VTSSAGPLALDSVDLEALARRHGVVGATLGVASGGERSIACVGSTCSEGGQPIRRDARYLIGSVAKAFVATAFVEAVASRAVDLHLDDDVRRILPRFAHGVTSHQLLTHTSGLPDLWAPDDDADDALERFVDGVSEVPLHATPGTRFGYSNAGYAVLGRLLEVSMNCSFERALSDTLLLPMQSAATFSAATVPSELLVVGHSFDPATSANAALDAVQGPRALGPAGLRLLATVDDLLSFGELHLQRGAGDRRGHALLADLSKTLMHDRVVEIPDPRHGRWMGRGLLIDDNWGTTVLLHDGGAMGQSAYLRVVPSRGVVVALLCSGGVPQVFHREVSSAVAPVLGLEVRPDVQPDPALTLHPEPYLGTYRSPLGDVHVSSGPHADLRLELTSAGGDRAGPFPLSPVNPQLFLAPVSGRPYSVAFELEPSARCPAVLAGLRRLLRSG